MAEWGKPEQTQEQAKPQNESLAYIHKDTREAAKENPTVDTISKALLEKAKEIMDKVSEAGLTTESKTRDGSRTYTDKAVVTVEPATRWNKEKQGMEELKHNDDTPIYKAVAEISHYGSKLTLTAKEDVSQGAEIVAMTASKWSKDENGKAKLNFYKQDDIANAPINKDIKAIANLIQQEGFIAEKEPPKENLQSIAVDINKYFAANSDKVLNNENQLVNNSYAQYDKEYNTVSIRNHTDNVVVELRQGQDGNKYALATDFDLNEKKEPRQQGEAPQKAFVNNADDLANLIHQQEIRDVVADFKQINLEATKEQSQEQDTKKKPQVERD